MPDGFYNYEMYSKQYPYLRRGLQLGFTPEEYAALARRYKEIPSDDPTERYIFGDTDAPPFDISNIPPGQGLTETEKHQQYLWQVENPPQALPPWSALQAYTRSGQGEFGRSLQSLEEKGFLMPGRAGEEGIYTGPINITKMLAPFEMGTWAHTLRMLPKAQWAQKEQAETKKELASIDPYALKRLTQAEQKVGWDNPTYWEGADYGPGWDIGLQKTGTVERLPEYEEARRRVEEQRYKEFPYLYPQYQKYKAGIEEGRVPYSWEEWIQKTPEASAAFFQTQRQAQRMKSQFVPTTRFLMY